MLIAIIYGNDSFGLFDHLSELDGFYDVDLSVICDS